ncbi:MAG: hypothetical protein AABW99_01700 [archaeon]
MDLSGPSEELRLALLKEELKLRKKQPEHWAKTKYRKYAMLLSRTEMKNLNAAEEEVQKAAAAKPKRPKKRKHKKTAAKKSEKKKSGKKAKRKTRKK